MLGRGPIVQIVGDGDYPTDAPLCLFTITDPRVSRYWELRVTSEGDIICLWPSSFFQEYYFDDLTEGDPIIREDFERVRLLIATEYGLCRDEWEDFGVTEYDIFLAQIRQKITQYLNGQIPFKQLVESVYPHPCIVEPDNHQSLVIRAKAALVDYVVGVIIGLAASGETQNRDADAVLHQVLRYINGAEPFDDIRITVLNLNLSE